MRRALVLLLIACACSAPPAVRSLAPPSRAPTEQEVAAAFTPPDPPTTTTTSTTAPPARPQSAPRSPTVRTASAAPPLVSAGDPSDADFDRLAGCESGGRWNLNTGNGFYGGLQFDKGTWNAYAASGRADGTPFPPRADFASREDQIEVARRLWRARGWAPWPSCSRQVGLR